eukprot:gb/GECH01009432.1/.p1 GENE.gb/GECH01009432.1/~~gb/GECH01009432.1/.p1  ORF type:complete len:160 (+),score=9.55 gb/GECH01009432.1/:1-480(+)
MAKRSHLAWYTSPYINSNRSLESIQKEPQNIREGSFLAEQYTVKAFDHSLFNSDSFLGAMRLWFATHDVLFTKSANGHLYDRSNKVLLRSSYVPHHKSSTFIKRLCSNIKPYISNHHSLDEKKIYDNHLLYELYSFTSPNSSGRKRTISLINFVNFFFF